MQASWQYVEEEGEGMSWRGPPNMVLQGRILGQIKVFPALRRSVSVIVDVCQLNGCDMQHTTSKHPVWHIPPICSMNTPPLSKSIHNYKAEVRAILSRASNRLDAQKCLNASVRPSPQWQRGKRFCRFSIDGLQVNRQLKELS